MQHQGEIKERSRGYQGDIKERSNLLKETTHGKRSSCAALDSMIGGWMIRPESYITDDLIWAFRQRWQDLLLRLRYPELMSASNGVSVQWLAGGCRLYRIDRTKDPSIERAEAPEDCSTVDTWTEHRGDWHAPSSSPANSSIPG
jgi:hypothetical protein